MKLENRFTVPVPRAEAWKVLLDVERIAPCMPGATLTGRDGDSFTGTVKVKVGPINLTYGGNAKFVSTDEENGVAVIEASGKETRGTGTAKATVTAHLHDRGDSTEVEVHTDMNVTGKPAQFGRGVLADVSSKLIDQFATCLAGEILAGTPDPAAASDSSTGTGTSGPAAPRVVPEAQPIDLLGTAGSPVLKRLAPVLAGLVALVLLVRRLRR
jgi:carbon monoxide dehydrogenase subunit G